jgi:Uma2 family endonuclease
MRYTVKKKRIASYNSTLPSNGLITFDRFYDLVDEKTKADLLDGLIIRDSPAIPKHAFTVTWTTLLIGNYNLKFNLGAVLTATATVRLSLYNAPEPDIFFIAKNRMGIIRDKYVDGPPDLCVEVVSKSSRKYDRGRKFVLYAEHGVKEYWLIDPLKNRAEFYENKGGEFVPIAPDELGRIHSRVLHGLWVKPEWFLADPLPNVLEVLDEILGGRKA